LHEGFCRARRTTAAVCSLKTVLMEIAHGKSEARLVTGTWIKVDRNNRLKRHRRAEGRVDPVARRKADF